MPASRQRTSVPSGSRSGSYVTLLAVLLLSVVGAARGQVVGADGAPRYDFALSMDAPDGTLERVSEREYESWTRSDAIGDRCRRIREAQSRQLPPGTESEIEDREQVVSDLRVAGDDRVIQATGSSRRTGSVAPCSAPPGVVARATTGKRNLWK